MTTAVLDDTCGNLIQIAHQGGSRSPPVQNSPGCRGRALGDQHQARFLAARMDLPVDAVRVVPTEVAAFGELNGVEHAAMAERNTWLSRLANGGQAGELLGCPLGRSGGAGDGVSDVADGRAYLER
jgi:hypothetical protein